MTGDKAHKVKADEFGFRVLTNADFADLIDAAESGAGPGSDPGSRFVVSAAWAKR
jgi:hypothetical protein